MNLKPVSYQGVFANAPWKSGNALHQIKGAQFSPLRVPPKSRLPDFFGFPALNGYRFHTQPVYSLAHLALTQGCSRALAAQNTPDLLRFPAFFTLSSLLKFFNEHKEALITGERQQHQLQRLMQPSLSVALNQALAQQRDNHCRRHA